MGKPRMIILIRHAQSEGNKNRDIHQTTPDHRVKLTAEGWSQALEAGRRLRSLLRPDDTLHFITSPYRRTRETTEGILSTLTSSDPSPSPFSRDQIKVYEEPRLREQDFGNFQPCSAEMERMWQERADYGHFFYRIPNGESAADAYDRVSGFNESLWRQFGEDTFASVCVLVTHGLMSRVFLMKWYHFSVEYFEDLRNVNHCEFLIMRKQPDSGRYTLENKLRTWSQLRKDRAVQRERERNTLPIVVVSENGREQEVKASKSPESPTIPSIPFRKRWGGCPDGCDHSKHHCKKENSMHAMQLNGRSMSHSLGTSNATFPRETGCLAVSRRPAATRRWQSMSGSGSDNDPNPNPDDTRGRTEPDYPDPCSGATSSCITLEDRLRKQVVSPEIIPGTEDLSDTAGRLGIRATRRDTGGSASGKSSIAGSDCDTDLSPEEDARKRHLKATMRSPFRIDHGIGKEELLKARPMAIQKDEARETGRSDDSTMGNSALNEQGHKDHVDEEGDEGGDEEEGENEVDEFERRDFNELVREEKQEEEEKSVMESVY